MLISQVALSEIKYLYYFNCHQSIGGDMLILFRLYCLPDKTLSMSSLISPVPYPVTSFIVGNLYLPE